MSGWQAYESAETNGWRVIGGVLVNATTETDFSPTGSYANLHTEAEFEGFGLHIEFPVEEV